jgi:hypothetical protein
MQNMMNEPPPTYAIFTVTEVVSKGDLIDHVIADISYPLLSITHTWSVSREDILKFLRSGEHFLYQNKRWNLIMYQGIEMIDFELENPDR